MSRAGSQVMKRGRREGREVGVLVLVEDGDGGRTDKEGGETRSIMVDNLSSSSGQMSGQCVKPK